MERIILYILVIAVTIVAIVLANSYYEIRSNMEAKILGRLGDARLEAERIGHKKGVDETVAKYRVLLSQPINPRRMPTSRYEVKYVVENGGRPVAALATRRVKALKGDGSFGPTVDLEPWLVALPEGRQLTYTVPFCLVVDSHGLAYEPWREEVDGLPAVVESPTVMADAVDKERGNLLTE